MDVMHVGQSLTKNFILVEHAQRGRCGQSSRKTTRILLDRRADGSARVGRGSGGSSGAFRRSGRAHGARPLSPGVDPRTMLGSPVLPGDGHHRTGVFNIAGFGSNALTYSAGGPDATLVLGDTEPTPPSASASANGHDYGDYGVVHAIDLTLSNPGGAPAAAYLFFKPLAGPARGSFLIDGSRWILAACACRRRTKSPHSLWHRVRRIARRSRR